MVRLRITITGRVQNVFFRHTAQKVASDLNLSGWAKNIDTGVVVCEVQGEQILAEQFVSFVLRGPRLAQVEKVTIEYIGELPEEHGFEIIS